MTHTYRGQHIYRCEHAAGEHRGRWIVQGYHRPTGMPYSDELCAHYPVLAEARWAIDDEIAHSGE